MTAQPFRRTGVLWRSVGFSTVVSAIFTYWALLTDLSRWRRQNGFPSQTGAAAVLLGLRMDKTLSFLLAPLCFQGFQATTSCGESPYRPPGCGARNRNG